ncbi:glycosyltransferase family 2 protein [Sediminibacterium sp. TEGAF015]|uniref:glycosyltransferase family 2 protein n=1 Tax=Sediminibacterium sp. TEGAF015 TaxID=575378 RepID=UPI00220423BB|nr:glycosyltransferase family 2 protein [Sediminibacterium sp. TEGAF015]BDQ12541.1 hypothetical protein TEGAF0_17580 [Sediminibacterium sp. TEGAF015]
MIAQEIKPLVSVILATYNGEMFIREQLESILNQTYPNIELIIIDDCSTDNTLNLIQDFCNNNNSCRLIKNESNLGYIKNFEKGMSLAQGAFIAPADQDDIWHPEKIEILINSIDEYTNIVYCDSLLVNYKGESLGKNLSDVKQLTNFNNCIMFAIGNSAAGHAMLIKRNVVFDSIPFPTMIPHDHWLGFVASLSGNVKFINKVLVQYRQHSLSVFGAKKAVNQQGKVVGVSKKRIPKDKKLSLIKDRVLIMYNKCPDALKYEKFFYERMLRSYENFSLFNNIKRTILFFEFNKLILSFKKRSLLRRWLFCIKMFVTIQ